MQLRDMGIIGYYRVATPFYHFAEFCVKVREGGSVFIINYWRLK